MLRYLHGLAAKDLTLANSMIPLGSCTMKLNATAEMTPVTWPEFGALHPFAPADQTRGYRRMIADLERMLGELTGFPAVSLQPNAGSQGELAGLLAIRAWGAAMVVIAGIEAIARLPNTCSSASTSSSRVVSSSAMPIVRSSIARRL